MTTRYTPIATTNMLALAIAIDPISEIIGKGHGSLIPRCWLAAKTPNWRETKNGCEQIVLEDERREELERRRAAVTSQQDLKPDDPVLISKVAVIDDEIEDCTRNMESTAHPLPSH
jgi:hypothetical protein